MNPARRDFEHVFLVALVLVAVAIGGFVFAGCRSVCATGWSATASESEHYGPGGEATISGEIGEKRCE